MTKAFNSERRSWNLKVDINSATKNVGVWIIERGETLAEDDSTNFERGVPVCFSSVKCQIEIVDAAIKNRKSVFFFSFSHDQNQVIGHQDIANLDHLADSKQLKIRVSIEEYIFHSALVHYFSNNFQRLLKEEFKKEEQLKVLSPIVVDNADNGLFHMSD